jgi:hypothetical protein
MDSEKSVNGMYCDCEHKLEWFSFRLNEDEYVCDWDDIHLVIHLDKYDELKQKGQI